MKLFCLFFTLSLMLGGCTTITPENKNTYDEPIMNMERAPEPGSDAFYLNIAKDLYVAGQYKQAHQITTGLAEKNNAEAQYLLGYLYYYGQGVPIDVKQGAKWITISADSGYRPAIEALVLIKHGLTPDNKCSTVNSVPQEASAVKNNIDSASLSAENEEVSIETVELKKGEILITPKNNKIKADKPEEKVKKIELIRSDKLWKRHTIQLTKTESKQAALDYIKDFETKFPDLKDYIVSYKSKSSPYTYGVGFSTFETKSDADIALKNLQARLNNSTLLVKYLEEYSPF